MPEIPEMEAYRRYLDKSLSGATVVGSEFAPRGRVKPRDEIAALTKDQKLEAVERNGKDIYLRFANGHSLVVHLMLTGRFNVDPSSDDPPETRVASFEFDNGKTLHLRDRSRWARVGLDPDAPTVPDALGDDFDLEYLEQRIKRSPRANVKTFLMDQKKVRGIGNGYSDEILWAARIAPQSLCGKLPDESIADLYKAIRDVLSESVEIVSKLDDPSDYRKARLRDMKVHNPERETTPSGGEIKQEEVGNNKSYFTDEQVLYD